jgi:hypothetical protein
MTSASKNTAHRSVEDASTAENRHAAHAGAASDQPSSAQTAAVQSVGDAAADSMRAKNDEAGNDIDDDEQSYKELQSDKKDVNGTPDTLTWLHAEFAVLRTAANAARDATDRIVSQRHQSIPAIGNRHEEQRRRHDGTPAFFWKSLHHASDADTTSAIAFCEMQWKVDDDDE